MSRKRIAPMPSAAEVAIDALRSDRRRTLQAFACIVALALAARILHLLLARSVPLFDILIVDGRQYEAWARRIAAGDWVGTETFYQAPLYPYFLAVLKLAFGDGLWPIRIVQATLGALSCGLLFMAARNFVSHRVGVVAGVLLALYPPAIFFDGLVQKASVGGFIVVLVLWLVSRTQLKPTWPRFVALGCALGLLMLTREETLLLVPAIGAWVAFRFTRDTWPKRAGWAALFVAGLALVLLPVGWRNYKVGGEFLITTSQAGTNFWIGNRPGADGRYAPLRPGRSDTSLERKDAVELAEIATGRKLTAKEVSDFWLYDNALAWIRDEPVAWVKLLCLKAALLVNWYEIPDAEDQYFYEVYEPPLALVSHVLHLGIVLPLCAAGIVLGWPRRRDLWVLMLMLAVLCAGVILFYVFARYRYPIVPIVIVFASVALVQGFALVRARGSRQLVAPGFALLATAVVSNWTIHARSSQIPMSHVNAGAALASVDRADEAVVQYRAALALDDDMPEAWSNLGVIYARLGRSKDALECIGKAVAQRPEDPRFHYRLGIALFEAGDVDRAVGELTRSTDLFPQDPEAWNNLRFIHARRRDWPRALDVARRGAAANSDDLPLQVALAWLLATCPDPSVRNSAEALALAMRCDAAGRHLLSDVTDVLAAALAAEGRFDEAHSKALEAAAQAERDGRRDFAAEVRARAALYANKKPYIDGGP